MNPHSPLDMKTQNHYPDSILPTTIKLKKNIQQKHHPFFSLYSKTSHPSTHCHQPIYPPIKTTIIRKAYAKNTKILIS